MAEVLLFLWGATLVALLLPKPPKRKKPQDVLGAQLIQMSAEIVAAEKFTGPGCVHTHTAKLTTPDGEFTIKLERAR